MFRSLRGVRSRLVAPFVPFAGLSCLAFAAVFVSTSGTRWSLVLVAACVALALTWLWWLSPWDRLPGWAGILPPLLFFVVLALLRESQGGVGSGYGSLAIVPVVWCALILGRRAVAVAVACGALTFGLPILIAGAPRYPATAWRGTLLWSVVALVVGLGVTVVIGEQRRQATLATRRAEELGDLKAAIEAIANVGRRIAAGDEARQLICEAACAHAPATFAAVVEHSPETGRFSITAAAGIPLEQAKLDDVAPRASLRAYESGERLFISDARSDEGVSRVVAAATGLQSVLYEPLLRAGETIGVLSIGWDTKRDRLDARTEAVCSYLAAEAAAAIERADLLARFRNLALTDELTKVANRRSWQSALHHALKQSRPEPACVALIDLDHFKAYNDRHGHNSGDELLEQATLAWQASLRPTDTLARYGGDEFAILLHNCTAAEAERVLDRLRDATPAGATCSVGLTELQPGDTLEALIARADRALYDAKHAGRNRLQAA